MLDNNNEPTTWLVPRGHKASNLICGTHPTLAMRITSHPAAQEICNMMNSPLISTSINLTAEEPVLSIDKIPANLQQQVDLVVAGADGSGHPSKIIHLEENKVIR